MPDPYCMVAFRKFALQRRDARLVVRLHDVCVGSSVDYGHFRSYGPFGWCWPWLEQCAANFDQAGTWPTAWAQDFALGRPLTWDQVDPLIRTRLLFDTLHTAVWRARIKASVLQFPMLYRPRLQPSTQPCPAAAMMAERFEIKIEQGNYV